MTTSWSRAQVEQLLDDPEMHYQRIALPYGLATRGTDRTPTADRVFPRDLRGKSVLDVGCYHGFFCLEAARRGASHIVGLEVNPARTDRARRVADCLNVSIDYRTFDIEHDSLDESFDIVLCLNVMHHFRNPLSVLDKLADAARDRLVLEVAGFGKHDRPALGIGRLASRFLRRSPVLLAAPVGANGRNYTPKFVLTAEAIENLLLCHRNTFARIDKMDSEFKDRVIAIGHKRRIGRLIVIAGPPAVGKSVLIDKLRSGAALELAAALDLPGGDFPHVEATRMGRITEPFVPLLVMHYNFLNPYNHNMRTYERDYFLDVLQCADELVFVTPWIDRQTLFEQFKRVKIDAMTEAGQFRGAARNKRLEIEYQDDRQIIEYYQRWFEFSGPRGRNIIVVRDGDGDGTDRITDIEDWRRHVATV